MSEEEESSPEVSQKKPLENLREIETNAEVVCPVPPPHVQEYEKCCESYKEGKMSDLDVLASVINSLKKIRENKE